MSATYNEPLVSILVLDYKKPGATKLLLESLRRHIKFDHKIIYLHNGGDEDYGYSYFKDGLIDQFIQTKKNNGLGVGTRDLFAASFSKYSVYCQNDHILGRDFLKEEFNYLCSCLDKTYDNKLVSSISLAGPVCGPGIYSERAHLIKTDFYKTLESSGLLGYYGAGPHHNGKWREAEMQEIYKYNNLIHYTYEHPMFIDNGREAIRQNPDGSIWRHEPDTKSLVLIRGPVKEAYVYPKLTIDEWREVIETQSWPNGKIPEREIKDSFVVPHWH
jgi:hypothetical protein